MKAKNSFNKNKPKAIRDHTRNCLIKQNDLDIDANKQKVVKENQIISEKE